MINQLLKTLIVFIALITLIACENSSGSKSSIDQPSVGGDSSGGIDTPDVDKSPTFATVTLEEKIELERNSTSIVNMQLKEAVENENGIIYFKWQRVDGSDIQAGSIRPVEGIIHLSQFDDVYKFEFNASQEMSGSYQLALSDESGQVLEKEIEILVQ